MGWAVWGSNPNGGEISCTVQIGPGAHPVGTGSFSGVKRPGLGVNHPPPHSAEVKETVELYIYSLAGPSWSVLGRTFTFTLLWAGL